LLSPCAFDFNLGRYITAFAIPFAAALAVPLVAGAHSRPLSGSM
jgi:hypothetical protein